MIIWRQVEQSCAQTHFSAQVWGPAQDVARSCTSVQRCSSFIQWVRLGPTRIIYMSHWMDYKSLVLTVNGVFCRIIEELRLTLLLPPDECRSYTLLEFKNALLTINQERRHILLKLSQCRGVILTKVPHLSLDGSWLSARAAAAPQKDHRSFILRKEESCFYNFKCVFIG